MNQADTAQVFGGVGATLADHNASRSSAMMASLSATGFSKRCASNTVPRS